MHNISSVTLDDAVSKNQLNREQRERIYAGSEAGDLIKFMKDWLFPNEITTDDVISFDRGIYRQNPQLFDFIRENYISIRQLAMETLAEKGFGLTETQDRILKDALESLRQKNPVTFIVSGGPGSGKTLIALFLLIQSLNSDFSSALAIRNNRLHAVLERIIEDGEGKKKNLPIFYFKPLQGTGVGSDEFTSSFDLLIIDEGQRMEKKIMSRVLSRAKVKVILLDESQRLNPPEQGTVSNFFKAAREIGDSVKILSLEYPIRCTGGKEYVDFVEKFLSVPYQFQSYEDSTGIGANGYELSSFEKIEDMIEWLKSKNGFSRVLVASFTESKGDLKNRDSFYNVRVGSLLQSGFDLYSDSKIVVKWLMSKSDYNKFWTKGKEFNYGLTASIYGTQGFEADYVGIIWGRDLIIRDSKWVLGDPDICFDTIDGLITGKTQKKWDDDALTLVKNRYRIFLTRGIRGTGIFFEDGATRNFFGNLKS